MSKHTSQDLFDDSVMTFGEHLEALRVHLWKAIIGLALGMIICLYFGDQVIGIIRKPIDDALRQRSIAATQVVDIDKKFSFWDTIRRWSGLPVSNSEAVEKAGKALDAVRESSTIPVTISRHDFARALHQFDPERFPEPAPEPEPLPAAPNAADPNAAKPGDAPVQDDASRKNEPAKDGDPAKNSDAAKSGDKPAAGKGEITLSLKSPFFRQFEEAFEQGLRPVTLTVQEAFMTYLKVSFISGFVLSSPWVIYQLWLFVAAGLYPHEKKYVYMYLPLSIGLFLGGVVFCFFIVFPFVLEFMLGYNDYLKVTAQIRLSEWINFAVTLPLLFGVSFQLPLVMLFLERISVFDVKGYREKRRLAILAIAIIAMILTPPDPLSMTTMMVPLIVLYEFGILLCQLSPAKTPFEAEAS